MPSLDHLHVKTPGLWVPPGLDQELSENVYSWQQSPNIRSEREVATRLAALSHTVIAGESSTCGFSRATSAIENNIGTCIAHSEVTIAFAALHGLRILAVWNNSDASILWPGTLSPWRIDPYFSDAREYTPQPQMSDSLNSLAKYLLSTGQGAYVNKLPVPSFIEASFITGPMQDNPCPFSKGFSRIDTLLTPSQAIEALDASLLK